MYAAPGNPTPMSALQSSTERQLMADFSQSQALDCQLKVELFFKYVRSNSYGKRMIDALGHLPD